MDEEVTLSRMEHLRRLLMFHSYVYYKRHDNLVTDAIYDSWARELGALNKKHSGLVHRGAHHEAFITWDGESVTGFDLPFGLPEYTAFAEMMYARFKNYNPRVKPKKVLLKKVAPKKPLLKKRLKK